MHPMHDELMNQMVAYRHQRVTELMAESRRGSRAGNAIRKHLGLSLIWLGEKLRQEGRPCPPELVDQGQLRARTGVT